MRNAYIPYQTVSRWLRWWWRCRVKWRWVGVVSATCTYNYIQSYKPHYIHTFIRWYINTYIFCQFSYVHFVCLFGLFVCFCFSFVLNICILYSACVCLYSNYSVLRCALCQYILLLTLLFWIWAHTAIITTTFTKYCVGQHMLNKNMYLESVGLW